jgi:multiple sugar transport system permease protein
MDSEAAMKNVPVIITHAAMVLCAVIVIFPILYMLSISLQTQAEIYAPSPVLIPAAPRIGNYIEILTATRWPLYFRNSVIVTVITVAVSLCLNLMAGYTFARIPFRFSNGLFLLVLVGMMIPAQVTMIPLFVMLRQIPLAGGNNILGQGGSGLYNTLAGLILPFIGGSFGVFFSRQYYVTFPSELDDSAEIDGCGRFDAFMRIYLPLSGPLLASLGVFKFTGTWNEYTWPLLMTRTDNMRTVQLALTLFRNESGIFWDSLMGAALLISLPVYAVFVLTQRYFISGLMAGSVKA